MINHNGTRMITDGELTRIKKNEIEKFRLIFSNRLTVTQLLYLYVAPKQRTISQGLL